MGLIEESIKLNEELSVSLEVKNETDKLMDEIYQKYDNIPFRKKFATLANNKGNISYGIKSITLYPNPPIFNCVSEISIHFITSYGDKNDFRRLMNTFNFTGRFNKFQEIIELNIPCYNEDMLDVKLIKSLSHELEHAYQSSKYTTSADNIEYGYATKNIQSNNKIKFYIANLYYYFTQKEIDAKIQEIYNQIHALKKPDLNSIYKTDEIIEFNARIKLFNDFFINNNSNDLEINNELKNYNLNKNTFIQYIERGINYFKIKLGKMITYHLNKMKEENNGIIEMIDRMIYLMNY